ncbi:TfoX/Sxy family protein [Eubacteriales bacterium OttesenSCG-928-K08]|nr:TfoX/Sxy family protein [Eubacteriales bacterium OttesenSCG-928-K08]
MSELSSLPNVGKVLEKNLIAAGITTVSELREIGTKEAFIRIRAIDSGACVQMLYGLHGAVIGVNDKELPKQMKEELKQFFKSL